MLGAKKGPDDPRHMHTTTIDFLEYRMSIGMPYKFIVLEIVLEMLDHEKGLPEQQEAVRRLRKMGYQVGLAETSGTAHDVVSAYEHGIPLHKVRMFTRAVLPGCGIELSAITPTRTDSDPKCLGDIMVPDCCVDKELFAKDDQMVSPVATVSSDPSVPRTVARVKPVMVWDGLGLLPGTASTLVRITLAWLQGT